MWFEELTGFTEKHAEHVKSKIRLTDKYLISDENGRKYQYGRLEVKTLAELSKSAAQSNLPNQILQLSEIIADAQSLHINTDNAGALFQVASQFNLLEMVSPNITPEHGVSGYEHDHTQGPACAVAAGAGTIYRNYFIPMPSGQGQTSAEQINCMAAIERQLDNQRHKYWVVKNGYLMASSDAMIRLNDALSKTPDDELKQLKNSLMIGVQWDTQVTLNACEHLVSQVYCSALPVAYNRGSLNQWEMFAKLILQASYEATLAAGVINYKKTGNKLVFLTLIGGGVFGNPSKWIIEAIDLAISKYVSSGLDVRIVSYKYANVELKSLLEKYQ